MDKLLDQIIDEELIGPGDQVLLALSGGADSVYLFHLLLALQERLDFYWEAAHVNHGLRGAQARADQAWAQELCQSHGIVFHSTEVDMLGRARADKISLEDAGRRLRYEYFDSLMGPAWKLALGHHKDDQIETVLLNLFRGTGLKGLAAMASVQGRLVRPLLGLAKEDILAGLNQQGLAYREDQTNYENDYRRNQVRNLILPYIQEVLGERVGDNIYRLAQLARGDNQALEAWTQAAYPDLVQGDRLDQEVFQGLEVGLQRRLIRYFFQENASTQDLTFQEVERVRLLFDKDLGKEERVQDLVFVRSYGGLYWRRKKEPGGDQPTWALDQWLDLPGGAVYAQVLDRSAYDPSLPGFFYDGAILDRDLALRNRRPGDRIQLRGMAGRKKVKDLMIDEKVPSIYRENMVLLVDGDQIYHIFHLRPSAHFPVTQASEKILWIKEKKE